MELTQVEYNSLKVSVNQVDLVEKSLMDLAQMFYLNVNQVE